MLRLLSSKAQGHKDLRKSSKPCNVGIHLIALADQYSQMSNHKPGSQSFSIFFASFHYGAKWTQIVKWPCMSGVHDQNFIKCGHQIACRDTTQLKNLNDIDTTSNDLEMTFNSVFSTYLTFGPSYCPLIIQ